MKKKKCTVCKKTQPLTEFYLNAKAPDGHRWKCKSCCRKYSAKWFKKNPERRKELSKRCAEKNKKRRLEDPAYDEEYKRKNREAQRKWVAANREAFNHNRNVTPADKVKNIMNKKKAVIKTLQGRIEHLRGSIKRDREQIKKLNS